MSNTSSLADSLTRIRNAQGARHASVVLRFSKLIEASLGILKEGGYIGHFECIDERKGVKMIRVDLKYHRGKPVISELNMISKPGCPVYKAISDLPEKNSGLGMFVLSTSMGICSDAFARANNIGGEVLFEAF